MKKTCEIAKYMVETGTQKTTEGNYIFFYDQLNSMFGVQISIGSPLEQDIVDALQEDYGEVLLSEVWFGDTGDAAPCFNLNFALSYCPNYEWHDGDESIFGSFREFENRSILPIPVPKVTGEM